MDEILKYFPLLPVRSHELLRIYAEKLLWWNERINLISRQDTENIFKHILHSLAIGRCIEFPKGTRILDLGTGGGLPGIPLAILFPDSNFTLIDSRGKKIKAVQSMIADLQLENATAIHIRAEEFQGEFDYVVSRAVASLKELWTWSAPLLQRRKASATNNDVFLHALFGSGSAVWQRGLIALKGGDLTKEIEEANTISKTGKGGMKIEVISIHDFFPEPYFEEKHIVYMGYPGK